VVPTDGRWRFNPEALDPTIDAVVWGRPSQPAGAGMPSAACSALRREIALWRARHAPTGRFRPAGVHRISGTAIAGGAKGRALRALRAGALVGLTTPDAGPRLLDVIAEAAGAATLRGAALRLGSGGAALARVSLIDGTQALLRMAPAGSPADPAPTALRLRALAATGVDRIPCLRGIGETGGIAWTAESVLPGRRPQRVSLTLAQDAAAFCARLPAAGAAPTAPGEDLAAVAELLRDHATALRRLAGEVERSLGTVPAVLRHGDLWAGNLLVSGGCLRGVVDWDAAHPLAMPGADLLQLIATERRRRKGLTLGEVWLQRPWRWPQFTVVTESYWPAVGLRLTGELAELLAVAWWATETSGTLRRLPHRASDGRWLAANIDPVLAALA
jgi:hypothetical protein